MWKVLETVNVFYCLHNIKDHTLKCVLIPPFFEGAFKILEETICNVFKCLLSGL